MTKDDKQFFRSLIYDLGKRMDNMDQKWDKRFDNLAEEVRHNGILIETLDDDVRFLAGEIQDVKGNIKIIKNDISEIKEEISVLPVMKSVIKKHSKQLAGLTN